MSLVKGKNIDTSVVSFAVPRTLDNGAKLVYVNYNGGRFSVQTPWMNMPWKMGVFTDGEFPKYSIDLSFKGMDENKELQEFHDKMKAVEQKIIDGGLENSVPWFKKKIASREGVVEKFNPIIKEYMLEKKIRLIVNKNSVVLGDSNLEITDQIILILNKEIKKLKLN